MLSEVGDLIFSLVVGYLGALELMYVAKHLYHWSCGHAETDADSLEHLQKDLGEQLLEATAKEEKSGNNVMQDGVPYRDGFRIEEMTADNETDKQQKRKELEKELEKQRKIEQETRKELEEAEVKLMLNRMDKEIEICNSENSEEALKCLKELKKVLKESIEELQANDLKKMQEAQLQKVEAAIEKVTNYVKAKALEAVNATSKEHNIANEAKERVEELQKEQRLDIESKQRIQEVEAQKVLQEKEQAATEALNKQQSEMQQQRADMNVEISLQEETQRRLEEAQLADKDAQECADMVTEKHQAEIEAEERLQEEQRAEMEAEEMLLQEQLAEMEAQKQLDAEQRAEVEAQQKLKEQQLFKATEEKRTKKQKIIEDNARKFLEAEREMVELQQKQLLDASPQFETEKLQPGGRVARSVKTQFGQTGDEPYSLTSKTLIFPGTSEEDNNQDSNRSGNSSLSTQPSEELLLASADTSTSISMQFPQLERQEPDGEDNHVSVQYTDEYLRSLDGIKIRPLVREDGSGRRRAFKKRRSSGSSNSSYDSRTSREEELKMFTSLEEEELKTVGQGENEYAPIKYSSEPTLRVKSHHRRHKRSPIKDMKMPDAQSSLQTLEEQTNPWGEVVPEHYKQTDFWIREKAISIDEEDIETEKTTAERQVATSNILPNTTSFEEASHVENEKAITTLKKQLSKTQASTETAVEKEIIKENVPSATAVETKKNVEKEQEKSTGERDKQKNIEERNSRARSSASPRLRRSPRIEEIDQYEERWIETEKLKPETPQTPQTPTITVQGSGDFASWRDEHGLMMEGLSDFYDFTASVNPSRSRPTSRNPSPANSPPITPSPNISINSFDLPSSPTLLSENYLKTDTKK